MKRKYLVLLILIIGGFGIFFAMQYQFKPSISGTIPLEGLSSSVSVIRDDHGIPYITASSQEDLFYALGFVNAQDRLWQMDLFRRIAQGKMAEVLGKKLLMQDMFFKTIGLKEIAQTQIRLLPADIKKIFEKFVQGVNRGIEKNWRKTIEFRLLGYKPEPWTLEDSISVFEFLMWQISYNFQQESIMAGIAQEIGIEKTRALLPPIQGINYVMDLYTQRSISNEQYTCICDSMPSWGGASNAWAVSGKKTLTGMPILANDTHLSGVAFPCPFYLVSLESPSFKAQGMMLPGVPCLLTGTNEHVAWGVTNMGADVQDLYIEKLINASAYLYKGKQKTLKIRTAEIKIRGEDIVPYTVQTTLNGPIIKKISDNQGISLRWCDMDGYPGIVSFFNLVQSADADAFLESLRKYSGIPLNFLYADTRGVIGYHAAGRIPQRKKGYGYFPSKGWEGENEWTSFIPFDSLPGARNPKEKYMVITNALETSSSETYLPGVYAPHTRTLRIKQLLNERDVVSLNDIKKMPLDVRSLLLQRIKNLIMPYLDELPNADACEARDVLKTWEGDHHKNSAGAVIMNVFVENLLLNVYQDEMSKENMMKYLSNWYYFVDCFMHFLVSEEGDAWFDDKTTPCIETKKEVIQNIFIKTIKELKKTFGAHPVQWRWGKMHSLSFQHFLGKKGVLKYILNIGPFEYDGGIDTLNRGSYDIGTSCKTNFATCSRMIVDLSDISKIYVVLSTGESGNYFSFFAKNQMKLFLSGKYLIMDPVKLKSNTKNKILTLLPQPQ